MYYYKQPDYYRNFKCIGGSCSNNCCTGWRIDWAKEEVDKLRNAPNCPENIRKLIDSSFAERDDKEGHCVVVFAEDKFCPFLTEDKFCRIQREMGVEYLSQTCIKYPRVNIVMDNICVRCCKQSCTEVTRALFNDPGSMNIVKVPIKNKVEFTYDNMYFKEDIELYPELKYCNELFDFFYDILSDKTHDIETSIILGALAAHKLTQFAEAGRADEFPEILKALRPQLHNGAQIKAIEGITPNYQIKLGLVAGIFKKLTDLTSLDYMYDENGDLKIDMYEYGEKRFKEAFKDRDFATRNIALNLFFELSMPFVLKNKSIFENYSIFAAAFALIKLNLIASAEWVDMNNKINSEDHAAASLEMLEEEITKRMALISRFISHNVQHLKKILAILKENKMTSPAYLALLIK